MVTLGQMLKSSKIIYWEEFVMFCRKKRIFILILSSLICFSMVGTVFAQTSQKDGEEEEILMLALPDGKGGMNYYEGEEAESIYKSMNEEESRHQVLINEEKMQSNNIVSEMDDLISLRGPFHYRYRFVKTSSGTSPGSSRRISNILINKTSRTQSLSMTAGESLSWSLKGSLSGKFYDVFKAYVGASWMSTSRFSTTLKINVAPHKKVWLEFKPLMNYISGHSEKYYVPRLPGKHKPVVVEDKYVYSISPRTIHTSLAGKYLKVPDGAYIWKEKKAK